MSNIKLKQYHYDEMLDRLNLISNIIETHLQQHHVAKIDIDIKDHICNAVDELYKASQKINTTIIHNKKI